MRSWVSAPWNERTRASSPYRWKEGLSSNLQRPSSRGRNESPLRPTAASSAPSVSSRGTPNRSASVPPSSAVAPRPQTGSWVRVPWNERPRASSPYRWKESSASHLQGPSPRSTSNDSLRSTESDSDSTASSRDSLESPTSLGLSSEEGTRASSPRPDNSLNAENDARPGAVTRPSGSWRRRVFARRSRGTVRPAVQEGGSVHRKSDDQAEGPWTSRKKQRRVDARETYLRRVEEVLTEQFLEKPNAFDVSDDEVSAHVKSCVDSSTVPCSEERCRDPDPYDLEPFSSEDIQKNCLAYPREGEQDTCMRPENFVMSLLASRGEGVDPLTRKKHCAGI